MEAESKIIEILGLQFSAPIVYSTLLTCTLIIIFCIAATRRANIRPGKLQNVLESIIDFTQGIIESSLDWKEGKAYHLYIFSLFSFILVANIIGLAIFIHYDDFSYFSSPTASVVVCLAFSLVTTLICHYSGVRKFGTKKYIQNSFLSPMSFMLPIKIIEEFTNTITLAFRLYGNIFAGEVLLGLVVMFASSFGLITTVFALPLEMIWQAFSVVIGAIQAYVFCTLTMVYISHKLESEH